MTRRMDSGTHMMEWMSQKHRKEKVTAVNYIFMSATESILIFQSFILPYQVIICSHAKTYCKSILVNLKFILIVLPSQSHGGYH